MTLKPLAWSLALAPSLLARATAPGAAAKTVISMISDGVGFDGWPPRRTACACASSAAPRSQAKEDAMTRASLAAFRALHRPGAPFVLANAWDIGTARLLAGLGADAIGTTSAGHAFTLGLPDGARITRGQALAHASELTRATPLPVSADLENGYGDAPDAVAETVRLAGEAGLAGCSIEDTALPGAETYPFEEAVARVRASAEAARAWAPDFVLVARADGVMTGAYGMEEALRRVRAFDEAGADCLYVPLLPDLAALRAVCQATAKPVNALVAGPFAGLRRADLAAAGAARISLGSSLARVAHAAVLEAARAVLSGEFGPLRRAAKGAEVDALLARGRA